MLDSLFDWIFAALPPKMQGALLGIALVLIAFIAAIVYFG
jgi:hypothetical protein